jgi:transposase
LPVLARRALEDLRDLALLGARIAGYDRELQSMARADERARRLTLPALHGVLIEEFEKVGRRLRASRAAHLMMVGLMHERTHARSSLSPAEVTRVITQRSPEATELGISPEDKAFVSAILDSAGN